jgi:hypothetical protein
LSPKQQNRSLHCASLRSAPVGMTEVLLGGYTGSQVKYSGERFMSVK